MYISQITSVVEAADPDVVGGKYRATDLLWVGRLQARRFVIEAGLKLKNSRRITALSYSSICARDARSSTVIAQRSRLE